VNFENKRHLRMTHLENKNVKVIFLKIESLLMEELAGLMVIKNFLASDLNFDSEMCRQIRASTAVHLH